MDKLRETAHRAQRSFLLVNTVPFAVGITLSCFTDIPAVAVYGKVTLGLVWGILQCALFVATAWLYESRSARSVDPLEQSLLADALHIGMSGAAPANRSER
ncbi:DUF485 domain-containing protein [Streptomyces sp. NPDC101234]|uniref:DUF485 domain-containing protein n=1 Tax=Streptomyces sp. NPDC101234 TaxID=3366138 RepID=UPI00381A80EC